MVWKEEGFLPEAVGRRRRNTGSTNHCFREKSEGLVSVPFNDIGFKEDDLSWGGHP